MNVSAAIQAMLAVIKNDSLKDLLPLLAAFFMAIAKNPTAVNIVAQLASLNAQIMATLPTIGQDALQSIANTLNTEVQAMVAAQTTIPAKT